MFRRALAAIFLFAAGGALPAPESNDPAYTYGFLPVHGRRMDTLVYDYNGDGRVDLLNTSVDFDQTPPVRWFALHLRDEKGNLPGVPTFIWPVDDRCSALILGDYVPGGGIEIAFLASDGAYYYPWKDGQIVEKPKKFLHLRTFFTTVSSNSVPVWSFAQDLDGDGRHDLIVPVADSYRVYFQTAPGVYGAVSGPEESLPNGATPALRVSRFAEKKELVAGYFSAVRQIPRVTAVDINGDKKLDLLTVQKDVITYFFQADGPAYFSRRPHRMQYTVPTLHEEVKKDTVNLAMVSFVDFNQDGVADLVVTKIEGTIGLTESVKTRIYLHIGTGRGNFIADKNIMIDGVSIDPNFIDMNVDGKLDVQTSRLRTDLLKQGVQLFLLGDVTISYEVFQFDPGAGMFLPEPVWSKDVLVTRQDLEKKGAASIALVNISGDFTGDKRPDMVFVNPKTESIELRRGRVHYSGKREVIGFEENAFWEMKLERHPKWLAIWDGNYDGLSDVYLMYAGGVGIIESRIKK